MLIVYVLCMCSYCWILCWQSGVGVYSQDQLVVRVFCGVGVYFLSHIVVSVAVGGRMDVVSVCADDRVAVYMDGNDGNPILSKYVFRDSVFDSVWDEDSAFCFDVCVVSVMLGFVHVSGVPVFGFLE